MSNIKFDPDAVVTGKLKSVCEDKTCFEKFISNGALEQCTVCGQVRDGELIRRLEAQINDCEGAIARIGESLERLTNIIVGLNVPEPITIDAVTGNVIIPSVPVEEEDEDDDEDDGLTEEEEERLTKPQ